MFLFACVGAVCWGDEAVWGSGITLGVDFGFCFVCVWKGQKGEGQLRNDERPLNHGVSFAANEQGPQRSVGGQSVNRHLNRGFRCW